MTESIMAYLLGPVVMLVVGCAIWAVARFSQHESQDRQQRWLDTHFAEWLHHRH